MHTQQETEGVGETQSLPHSKHARSACMVPRSEPVIDFVEHGIVAGEVVNVALKKSFIEGKANPRAASAFACFDLPQPLELSRTSAQTQTWRACQHVNEGAKTEGGGHEGTSTHTHTHSLANYLFNDTLVGIVLDERPIRVLLVGVLLLQPCTRTTKTHFRPMNQIAKLQRDNAEFGSRWECLQAVFSASDTPDRFNG